MRKYFRLFVYNEYCFCLCQDPEWNEEFQFACREEDKYVNVCVWCRLLQAGRTTKMTGSSVKDPALVKNTPPTEELPYYNVTSKIGFVS